MKPARALIVLATLGLFGLSLGTQGPVSRGTAPIEGRVVDYKTEQPIAGLEITAALPGSNWDKKIGAVTTKTNAKGHFRFEGLPNEGILHLFYTAGGRSYDTGVSAGDKSIAIHIRDTSFRVLKVGQSVPDMDLKVWLNSKSLDSNDLKGKVVLLDFWAISCAPCCEELPSIEALAKKYQGQALVIGVHGSGMRRSQLAAFAQKKGLTYPLAIDHGGDGGLFTDQFITLGIPTLVVLDRTGKIAQINASPEDADKKIQELLAAPQP